MTIIAKTVIDKQFWILQDDHGKIGNIEACANGYQVRINNQVEQFKTIRMLQKTVKIEFEHAHKIIRPADGNHVHGYPTAGRPHNGIWNVPSKLPLYTKTSKSKSWYAAGWYQVRSGRQWEIVQDPKLILLQRYPYHGPFYTKEAANEHSPAKVC
jgi:hypothetical protein